MSPDPTSSRCHLKNYSYHIQTHGLATLPPLVFLHGFMGSCRDFERIMVELLQHFYCVSIDLPGHGRTQVLGDATCYGMEAIALSLIQVLDHLNLGPCHLLGYSMGGRVALYLVLHYPEYFRSVILESASPGLVSETDRRDRRQHDAAIAHRLETETFDSFLDWWYGQPLFHSLRDHPTYEAMLQRRRDNNPQELARSLRQLGLGQQLSLWSKLQDLTLPCRLIVGERDQKFVDLGQRMTAAIATANLCIVQHCGHSVHQEQPLDYASNVRLNISTHKKSVR